MKRLIASPTRVYVLIGLLAAIGMWAGLNLPVSLFPNSTRPDVRISLSYGSMTAEEFRDQFGNILEAQLQRASSSELEIETISALYSTHNLTMNVLYKWGSDPDRALRETQAIVNAFSANLPEEARNSASTWMNSENAGFLAISFYSKTRELDQVFNLIEPIITPRLARVPDALKPELWNPNRKEIKIELKPQSILALGISPQAIDNAVRTALTTRQGGSLLIGTKYIPIQLRPEIKSVSDLQNLIIIGAGGRALSLSDVATVSYGPETGSARSFKTSGAPSLILFATPKPGGNVKRMAEDIIAAIKDLKGQLPADVEYKILVDPSEFIRSAINNVVHEVILGTVLAVIVLFVFIGSLRNVITTAVEIPISMVLAFILMKMFGMNLNLISLAGLALAAGMNVDASVVVMENIFRHFEANKDRHQDANTKLQTVMAAVAEVRGPVIASTIASLVVFLPLVFTSGLSYAILGDLAKSVVFSHAFSAIVALILVPTVRLHLMRDEGSLIPERAPIDPILSRLEHAYGSTLEVMLQTPWLKWGSLAIIAAVLAALVAVVLPRLPKEIIGSPDTDWLFMSLRAEGNTLLRQMETEAEKVERELFNEFPNQVSYTFNQINGPNQATLMLRLQDKSTMRDTLQKLEARFTNTTALKFWIGQWNPSELPLPDPPHFRAVVRGGEAEDRVATARGLSQFLEEKKFYPRVWSDPSTDRSDSLFINPHAIQWALLNGQGLAASPTELVDNLRVATSGRRIGEMTAEGKRVPINMSYPDRYVQNLDELQAFPLNINGRILPLKALNTIEESPSPPAIYREDGAEFISVEARLNTGEEGDREARQAAAKKAIAAWQGQTQTKDSKNLTSITVEDADKDLSQAVRQLAIALAWSVALIFFTMVLQFGTIIEPLLVLVAVPLGFVGVITALWVFGSTLSLNSVLGVILLNGIAVNNSIILVDFTKRLHASGMSAGAAALAAAKKRLRPILITSLTTILGLAPIAFGFGEGGRILQPLGIAVTGGLWVSMTLTLLLVPALHASYLKTLDRRHNNAPAEAKP